MDAGFDVGHPGLVSASAAAGRDRDAGCPRRARDCAHSRHRAARTDSHGAVGVWPANHDGGAAAGQSRVPGPRAGPAESVRQGRYRAGSGPAGRHAAGARYARHAHHLDRAGGRHRRPRRVSRPTARQRARRADHARVAGGRPTWLGQRRARDRGGHHLLGGAAPGRDRDGHGRLPPWNPASRRSQVATDWRPPPRTAEERSTAITATAATARWSSWTTPEL